MSQSIEQMIENRIMWIATVRGKVLDVASSSNGYR